MTGKGTRRKHPIFALEPASPNAPRIGVEWLDRDHEMVLSGPYGHQFLAITFFERGGGRQRIGSQAWDVAAGDLFVIAPGETHEVGELGEAQGWMVQFSADAIEPPQGSLRATSDTATR